MGAQMSEDEAAIPGVIAYQSGGDPEEFEHKLYYQNTDIEDIASKWENMIKEDEWTLLRIIVLEIVDRMRCHIEESNEPGDKNGNVPGKGKQRMDVYNVIVVPVLHAHRCHFRKAVLLRAYQSFVTDKLIERYEPLEELLITKRSKSGSGVLVITVLTSPFPTVDGVKQKFSCKWNCYYCPNEPNQPRSYLRDEPAVLRANQNGFDPVLQFYDRSRALAQNGHPLDKVELLVLGGTWSSYQHSYQEAFIRDLFYAANTVQSRGISKRPRGSLAMEQLYNESAICKIIGLTLETRPDCVTFDEIIRLRRLGCTRVQLGVQHTDDDILRKINRECYVQDTIRALRLLKDSCFKVDIHLMPNLPGSSVEKDEAMFAQVLQHPDLQADQWKIYPCETVPWTVIRKWYNEGKYTPYSEDDLMELLIRVKKSVHPWIRLNRVIRDIPAQYIIAGVQNTSLREVLQRRMQERGFSCRCIRCREVGVDRPPPKDVELVIRQFNASDGIEYFISFESKDRCTILGFVRLRINRSTDPRLVGDGNIIVADDSQPFGSSLQNDADMASNYMLKKAHSAKGKVYDNDLKVADKLEREVPFRDSKKTDMFSLSPFTRLNGAALVRELHVYGQLVPTSGKEYRPKTFTTQHTGLGKRLMLEAERISREKHFAKKIVLISGVGVRDFYRSLGYSLCGENGGYMMEKELISGRFSSSRNRIKFAAKHIKTKPLRSLVVLSTIGATCAWIGYLLRNR